jgi:hypothetical protein
VLVLQLPSKHQMLQTVHHQQENVFKRNTKAIAPGQVITTIYYIAACIPQLVIATMYQVLCCHLTFQFNLKFRTIKQFSQTIKPGVHITVKPLTGTAYAQVFYKSQMHCRHFCRHTSLCVGVSRSWYTRSETSVQYLGTILCIKLHRAANINICSSTTLTGL